MEDFLYFLGEIISFLILTQEDQNRIKHRKAVK
jgi:hypothetical protein